MYIYLYMNCALQTKVGITIKQQLMLHTSYSLFPSSPVLRIRLRCWKLVGPVRPVSTARITGPGGRGVLMGI